MVCVILVHGKGKKNRGKQRNWEIEVKNEEGKGSSPAKSKMKGFTDCEDQACHKQQPGQDSNNETVICSLGKDVTTPASVLKGRGDSSGLWAPRYAFLQSLLSPQ